MKGFYVSVLTMMVASSAFAARTEFSINTKDGLSKITGEIDTPDCGKAPYAAVFMVGGTGLFSRNVFFGNSKTDRDLVFADLSQRLNKACVATIRFDDRGVSCDLKSQSAIASCIDQKVRAQVTDQTILDDIQSVYDFATARPEIDKNKLVLFGHSEGSMNVSRLVAQKTVDAQAILFMGGMVESEKGIMHWQMVDRMVGWMKDMDSDHSGIVTNDEIKAGFDKSQFKGNFPIEALLSDSGQITLDEVTKTFEANYAIGSKATLAQKPSDPYLQNGVVFSAYQWWQRWFTDDVSVMENLKEFAGPIEYHNGDIDSQTPGLRENALLQANAIAMKSKPTFVLHPGKGHGLGNHPLYGPIDEEIANSLVQSVTSWLAK